MLIDTPVTQTDPFQTSICSYFYSNFDRMANWSTFNSLMSDLKERFEVSEADFKSLEDDLKLNIKLVNGETSTDLIRYLNTKATINHYVELIPTANDIFIQTVNSNSRILKP